MSETPCLSFACFGGLGNGGWRGALRVAQRQAPLPSEGLGELGRRLPAEAGAFGVVVRVPDRERGAGMGPRREQGFVQEFVTQVAVEALHKSVLYRLAWHDVVPFDLVLGTPLQDRVRSQFGAIACWE